MASPDVNTVEVCAFDDYGTMFDVKNAAQQMRDVLNERKMTKYFDALDFYPPGDNTRIEIPFIRV